MAINTFSEGRATGTRNVSKASVSIDLDQELHGMSNSTSPIANPIDSKLKPDSCFERNRDPTATAHEESTHPVMESNVNK
jgi:hypothetical protein